MSRKLSFRVVYWSSEEDDYPAVGLQFHTPLAKGWRSSRYCTYPQEIVLQLSEPVRLRKLQILSHQYMIASKIELHIGICPPGSSCSYHNCRFQRLGYISLSDNKATQFQARELKSIHIDAIGQFIKFVSLKNYINKRNIFNQVGLVAVNVIGGHANDARAAERNQSHTFHDTRRQAGLADVLHSYLPPGLTHSMNPDPLLWGSINRTENIPAVDDLMFDMYIDPETASLIRKLEIKKNEAVSKERFDYAKKLKQAIADLRKVGERLGRYEVEKQKAVQKEDYDTAQMKKMQSDQFRMQIYSQLDLNDLLELDYHQSRSPAVPVGQQSHHKWKSSHSPDPIVYSSPPRPVQHTRDISDGTMANDRALTTLAFNSPLSPRHSQSPVMNSRLFDESDERPLPALANRSQANFEAQNDDGATHSDGPEPLSDKSSREASSAIEIFDLDLVMKAYSKVYSFREEALNALLAHLIHKDLGDHDKVDVLRATVLLLRKALTDKVHSVFLLSLNVLKILLTTFAKKHKLSKENIVHVMEKTVPLVLAKGVDMTVRIRDSAKNFVKELAEFPLVKPLSVVGPMCVEPIKPRSPGRLYCSRLEVVEMLIKEQGVQNKSGLTVDNVMKFVCPALEHTQKEVRDVAVRIILDLYQQESSKAVVRSHLPDTEEARKKTLWKMLFRQFDKMDGIPTVEEQQAVLHAEERQKQEEVQKLKEQLATLKDLASGKVGASEVDLAALGLPGTGSDRTINDKGIPKSLAAHSATSFSTGMRTPIRAHADRRRRESKPHTADAESNKSCVFCGDYDDSYDAAGLEKHYLDDCPMLQRCTHCNQVVEIAQLTDHCLSECESKANFKECPHCKEAIQTKDFEEHTTEGRCKAPTERHVHCPLCHENVAMDEEGWVLHLTSKDGCQHNSRRREPRKGKRRKPQAGAGGQGAGRGVTGGRKIRGVTRGSKLPVRGRSKQH
ncbi:centrosomal protein of 104 kDa-like isoform X2 [Corticium candelabrum]|uniref:centrosomal protein of 104 kDa-like isoform X2 n=1 Tax=Corticium candelabrum TaxID=121492 RepID=UPI002E25E2C7|nr:centrosomal protein of 104 kDa-like isoform X2 [Corticium candelabrum]